MTKKNYMFVTITAFGEYEDYTTTNVYVGNNPNDAEKAGVENFPKEYCCNTAWIEIWLDGKCINDCVEFEDWSVNK